MPFAARVFVVGCIALLTLGLPALSGCKKKAAPPATTATKSKPAAPIAAESPPANKGPSSKTSAVAPEAQTPGRALYARHCAACHGEQGDGKGLASDWLFPKPRDFTGGNFRLVSSSNGAPTREDLHAVLARGMPGSAMPPWKHLSQPDRDALVDEVVRLYQTGLAARYAATLKEQEGLTDEELQEPEFQDEIHAFVTRRTTPGEATAVPQIAEPDADALARGKDLYAKQGCASCHGATGKGDGQQQMVDTEGLPTRPRDFTRGIFKGGHDPASIFRRIAYGMPGTPMPSSTKLAPEEVADMVHFVLSLSDEPAREATILNRERIVAPRVAAAPENADDSAWSRVEPTHLRMAPLWWRDDADPGLQVRALHDGKSIALLVNWRDVAEDRHDAGTHFFEDAVAVEFYTGDAEPFVGMGDPKTPVDVWFWDADRQGQRTTVEDIYPNTVVDVYPFHEQAVSSAEFNRPEAQDENQAEVSLPARAVGNPIALPATDSAGTALTAGGPSTVTFRMPRSQLVAADGQWSDGQWTVILRRKLKVEDPADGVTLASGGRASIAFAVWDGVQRDRDGKKLVTIWQDLELEP
jgi:DMSO reductase family type II enzyme heme b subunit